jgi:hypothetical protein
MKDEDKVSVELIGDRYNEESAITFQDLYNSVLEEIETYKKWEY